MSAEFVHLHLRSEYSLVDSVIRIPQLVDAVANSGMPAVAITDHCNLFAAVKFYKAALAAGVKPIFGADVLVGSDDPQAPLDSLVLLCRNDEGYLHLKQLITRAYTEGQCNGTPVIHTDWLTGESVAGLIALSGAREGTLGRLLLDDQPELARDYLAGSVELFGGDFYIEIQRTGRDQEDLYVQRAVQLASDAGCALVATNDVRYLHADEFEAHEARTCVQGGYTLDDQRRPRLYSDQQFLRSAQEMQLLFADLPEALANTVVIAQRCNVALQLGHSVLPDYEVPAGETTATYLAALSRQGLDEKLADRELSREQREVYDERLQVELDVITSMDFPGYFLIVADFIRWAKENGVPVGPGRGSGAGSLVAWVVGITNLDPLQFDLLFERFLNPERVSMPDFDIDFCMDGRDRVIEYVAERYGRDKVSQIITYGTMGAKAVIRDVGRVMGHPYGFADRIARLIPGTPGMTLKQAFEDEPELGELYERDDDVRGVIDMARQLEGLARNAGTHAGGVVIAPSPLTDFAPLYQPDGETGAVTQFDMKDVEQVGLVKFDFLGLRTLTIIDWALDIANAHRAEQGKEPIDIDAIPMDDPATFGLLQSSKTHAVFQLESPGMRDLIKRLRPDCFDDIVALVALFRPGPLQSGMVDTFIERKHSNDESKIDYMHPSLQPVLKGTYGVILYQEQVMQAAQILAGYSLGQADLLRRAMGKKIAAEMAEQRDIFVSGAVANGVDKKLAIHIFGLMEKFAEYGFNKSHSAAYALLAYQTAWLKAHYPEAFLAAVLTADMEYTDKLALHHRECRAMGINLLSPDVNASGPTFTVAGKGAIRYGLGALKGLGRGAAEAIVAEREANGNYADLYEFCCRIDTQKVNKRSFEALVKSGALDQFGVNRPSLMKNLPLAIGRAEQFARDRATGQGSLFGEEAPPEPPPKQSVVMPRWSPLKLYMKEHEALGLFLSGHPFDQYREDCAHLCTGSIRGVLRSMPRPEKGATPFRGGKVVTLAGLITDVRKRNNRVSMYLDDGEERIELGMYQETYQGFRHLLEERSIRVVSGKLRFEEFIDGWRLNVSDVKDIDRVIEQRATGLLIHWLDRSSDGLDPDSLRDLLSPHRPGRCDVEVQYTGREAKARLRLGSQWRVRPSGELREKLAEILGAEAFRFDYREQSGL
ncbi:MAG: DNA polymerase III subunit alpha [Gammaproteobacteria bacterium]|nr:DNA polymerase III subunit alpha [Gammaproteobacteria bacterium]